MMILSVDGAGQPVEEQKQRETVAAFAELWGMLCLDCGPQDYEWMRDEIINRLGAIMTDNEKAATYIGWKVGQICVCPAISWTLEDESARCDECGALIEEGEDVVRGIDVDKGRHTRKAPDMTKPENYMRAVETIVRRGVLHFEFGRDGDGFFVHALDNDGAGGGYDGGDWGEIAVRVLASLYEANFR